MTESPDPNQGSKPESEEAVEEVRTEEPKAPFGAEEEEANADVASDDTVED